MRDAETFFLVDTSLGDKGYWIELCIRRRVVVWSGIPKKASRMRG